MNKLSIAILGLLAIGQSLSTSCSTKEDGPDAPDVPDVPAVSTDFARGADVSWVTSLEKEGYKFYDKDGRPSELMSLLKNQCGVDAIRLRVWVNPADGMNGKEDVLEKASRANRLGLKLMIDFHFADTWADPGHQPTPAAWADYDIEQLKVAVSDHVKDVLSDLKRRNITPEWVQIGNETTQGMLWPLGKDDKPENFTALVNSGYDAVKSVFPSAKVIVHLDKGDDLWRYNHILGILKANGGKYDMIGMSLYPEAADYAVTTRRMLDNIDKVYETYQRPVMVCEIGMNYRNGKEVRNAIKMIRDRAATTPYIKGVFYWEPEAPAGYNGGYDKGCFVDGRPTEALDAFK